MLHTSLNGVRACIFDAGGTLVHPDWPRLTAIAKMVSGSVFEPAQMSAAFAGMLRDVGMEMQREGFVIPEEMKRPHWTFNRMYRALGLDAATCARVIERLNVSHLERHIWCGVDPEATGVLDELKRQGLTVAVISNTEDGRLRDSLEAAGISERFDLLVDSHLVGHRKPDPAIFHFALDALRLKPAEAAYVGDSYAHDALAAQRIGLRGILLDPLNLHSESVCPRISSLGELIGDSKKITFSNPCA